MEDFLKLLAEFKCARIRIDLSKDFPVTLTSAVASKKAPKTLIKDLCVPDDIPMLIDQIDKILSSKSRILYSHFRIMTGERPSWFLICCEPHKEKFSLKTPYLTGILMNVSDYIESVNEDPAVQRIRSMSAEKTEELSRHSADIIDILDIAFLRDIQLPFKLSSGVFSAVFAADGKLICTPNPGDKSFDPERFPYSKKIDIRISHSIAAYWIIASHKPDAVEKNTEMLEMLASTVSKLANAYVMLSDEMTNTERSNKLLGENIEQQILINSVYSIILEHKDSGEALRQAVKYVGEYMKIDKISVYMDIPEEKVFELNYEWVAKTDYYVGEKTLAYDAFPEIHRQLEYSDVFYPMDTEHELRPYGVKSFFVANLNGNGKRYGIISYEILSRHRPPTPEESKMLRSVSQIAAATLMRHRADKALAESNKKLLYLAFHDSVLDIPNRSKLDKDLGELLEKGIHGAAISLKVTNMRMFNQLFGHAYTDGFLKVVAHHIKGLQPENATVYRFAGNTLMILVSGCDGLQVKPYVETLVSRFKKPWLYMDADQYLECGAGVALFPECGKNHDEIYRAVSLAMYRASEYRVNSYAFFSEEFQKPATIEYSNAHKLRAAISGDMQGFYLKYQPIIEQASGKPVMCEAFVHWQDSDGTLPPSKLVSLAESLGLDIALDKWVIRNACRVCKSLQQYPGMSDFAISVNTTSRELLSGSILSIVEAALEESGLRPESLCIEIPERILSLPGVNIATTAGKLKRLGVKIAIDNFGYDFMAPALLRHSYIDYIKSDFSLFANIFDEFDEILLDTVIKLAKTIKGGICVKRIEAPEQLDEIKGYDIPYMQGHLYAVPLVEAELLDWAEAASKAEAASQTEAAPRAKKREAIPAVLP